MSYRWQVSNSPANPHLDAFLSQYYSPAAGSFTIPAEKLRANSELIVTLYVINAFGYSNRITGLVRILQGTLPGCSLQAEVPLPIAQEYYEFPLIITQCGKESSYEVKLTYEGSNCTKSACITQS